VWVDAVKRGSWSFVGREKQLEFALKAIESDQASAVLTQLIGQRGVARDGAGPWIELIGSAGGPAELKALFEPLLRGEFAEPVALRANAALGDAARLRSVKPAGDLGRLAALLDGPSGAVRTAALQLAGTWKLTALTPKLLGLAESPKTAPAERTAAFGALREIGGPRVIAALGQLAGGQAPLEIRQEAVVTLAGLELPTALPHILTVLKATTDEAQAQALWRSLLAIRGVSGRLATVLPKTELPRVVARAGLRPAREGNQHQALVPVLLKQAGLAISDVQLSTAELQAIAREAVAKGNPAKGEQLYRRPELACMSCHAIGGAGAKIGPDLTSIGASAPADYLVESVLYPSAKIKEGYHAAMIATKDGKELSGMITRESGTEIVLRDAANQEVSVPVQSVTKRTSIGSLMPAGLIDSLLPEERLDLFAFLAQLGKPGEFDAGKGGVARAWKLYIILSTNEHLGLERVVAGDFSLKDWQPVLSLVSGKLSKELIEATVPNRGNNRGFFAATAFESAKGGTANFTLDGKVQAIWVNGVEVKPAATFSAAVKPGANRIVMQLDDVNPPTIRLRSEEGTFGAEAK
jgi:putative heme-binding domain-containing protein